MNVINIKNVSKNFKIYHDKGSTLKEKILFQKRNYYEKREVLKNISLNISQGEVVGLIGSNGCGKSTLLKLMSKIMYPDSGEVSLKGKVSSLLELGAGFHPDLSGRENIYMNASIFGLTRREIEKRIDDIIDFSELIDFIDNPVRTYSSGMYMRLAFSVAINVDADILLIDEILAVGDVSFQNKCFNKLKELKQHGRTIVIVSHDLESLKKICNRILWIKDGKVILDGAPLEVSMSYLDSYNEETKIENKSSIETENEVIKDNAIQTILTKYIQRWGNRDLEIVEVSGYNSLNEKIDVFKSGESIKIEIFYKRHNKEIVGSVLGIGIFTEDGLNCYGTNTDIDGLGILKINDEGKFDFLIETLALLKGKYFIDIALHNEGGLPYDYIRGVYKFEIFNNKSEVGIVKLEHSWET
ncbi:ABC transporter ATP-binding protein [Acetoanaerobium noterae]|uniref:ABC transporter ATP-binding protein n=1 Tax=Acetoanaerobium noterae TaxID=745369 RepID=UPI0028ABC272|nr:ABC transporter ATP-binding protein [Acetoanaerobium noterae]